MTYTKQDWRTGPTGGTAVSPARLAHIEQGIGDAHDLLSVPSAALTEIVQDVIGPILQGAGWLYDDVSNAFVPPAGSVAGVVSYSAQQTLTADQRAQARLNSGSLADGPARFHVADWGVRGDGTTDDYPAFCAAAAAAFAYIQATSREAILDFEGMGTILFGSGTTRSIAQQHSAGTGSSVDATIAGYNKLGIPVPPSLANWVTFSGRGTVVKGSAACICFAFPDRTNDYQVWQNLRFDRVTWDDANVGTVKGHCIWGNQPSFGVKMRYTSLQDLEALDCVVLNAATDTSTSVGGGAMSRAGFFWTGDQNGSSEAIQTFTRRIRTRGGTMNGGDQLYAFYCTVADRYRAGGPTMGGVNHLHDDIDIGDGWRHVNTAWTPTQQRYQTSVYIGGSTNAGGRGSIGLGYVENVGDDCIEVGGMLSMEIAGVRCKDPLFNLILFRNTGMIDSARQTAIVRRTRTQVTTALSSLSGTFAAPYAWIADDLYLQVGYTGTVTGGTFTITIPLFSGTVTTAPIAWNATAQQVAAAIDAVVPAQATSGPNGGVTGYSGGTVNSATPTVFVLVKQGISTSTPVSVTSSLTGGGSVSVGIAPFGTAFGRYTIEDPWFEADGLNQSRQGRTSLMLKGPENGVPILGLHVVRPRMNLLNYTYTNVATGYQLAAIVRAVSLYANWPTEVSVTDGVVRARGGNLAGGSGYAQMSMVAVDGYATLGSVDGLVTDFSGSSGGVWGDVLVGQNFGAGIKAFVKRLRRKGLASSASHFGVKVGTEGQVTIAQVSESDFSLYATPADALQSSTGGTYGAANTAALSAFANVPASVKAGSIGSSGGGVDNTTGAGASTTAAWSGSTSQAQVSAAQTAAASDASTKAAAAQTAAIADAAGRYASLQAQAVLPMPQPKLTLVTTFASGHGFAGSGTGTTTDRVASDAVFGSQYVRMVSGGAGAGLLLTKNSAGAFTAVDCTSRRYAILCRIADDSQLQNLYVYLYSDNGTANYAQYTLTDVTANGRTLPVSGEWTWIYFTEADRISTGGTWNPAAVTGWRVRLADRSTGTGATLDVQALGTFPRESAQGSKGIVSFTCDDGFIAQRAWLAPTLAQYGGWQATAFPIQETVASSGSYYSVADMLDLQRIYRWEFGCHASALAKHQGGGYPQFAEADIVADISANIQWLVSNGIKWSGMFAYPGGGVSALVSQIAARYFSLGRSSLKLPYETALPDKPMDVRSVGTDGQTVANLQAAVTAAINNKTWTVFRIHDIVAANATGIQTLQSTLTSVFDTVKAGVDAGTLDVLTMGQVARRNGQGA